jgi:RNA polymerase sigma factor (sigma-70 family)
MAIRRLLRTVSGGHGPGLSDAELLERFVRQRDEAAVETLLWRHGPMVLCTCRRLLGNLADAEDCFQATFLVLCRKAATISKRQSVGSWLYKVAYRICLRAQAARSRQPTCAANGMEPAAPAPFSDLEQQELRAVLDEELNRLPEKYRAPLVLHYLQGKTVEQAAQDLGWHQGTVCVRLARGKEVLRHRLTRRGVTLSSGLVAGALAQEAVAGALPPALPRITIQAAVSGAGSPQAAALAQEFLRTELARRLKWALALLLLVGTAAATAGIALHAPEAEPPNPPETAMGPADSENWPIILDPNGDPLPAGAVLRLGTVRFRHGAGLLAAAYSPDGKTLASAGDGGLIRLWDAATGKPIRTLRQPGLNAILTLAFSPDGRMLASGGFVAGARWRGGEPPSPVALWDTSSGRIVRTFTAPGTVYTAAFSPDGRTFAAGGEFDSVMLWNAATGAKEREFNAAWTDRLSPGWKIECPTIRAVAFSPNRQTLVAGGKSPIIRRWDLASGAQLPPMTGEFHAVIALAFSADGKKLFSGEPGRAWWWDTATGEKLTSPGSMGLRSPNDSNNEVVGMALSPDGATLAVGYTNGSVLFFDATTGRQRAEMKDVQAFDGKCWSLCFSPDSKRLASAATHGEIVLWDTATAERIRVTEPDTPEFGACYAAVSPDGTMLATAARGKYISLWDARTARRLGTIGTDANCGWTAFSADGTRLMAQGWHIWDRDTKQAVYPRKRFDQHSKRLVLSPDGRYVAAPGISSFSVYLTNSAKVSNNGQAEFEQRLWGVGADTDTAETVIFSPDSRYVAYATGTLVNFVGRPVPDNERPRVVIKETATGRDVRELPCSAVCRRIAFAPDGQIVAAACDDGIYLWDAVDWQPLRCLEERTADRPHVQTLHPMLRPGYYATLPTALRTVLGETTLGVETRHYRSGAARVLAISPDSRTLAADSAGNRITLWDMATGRSRRTLRGHEGRILSLAFTPDGQRLVSGSDDTTALIWDISQTTSEYAR